MFVVAEYVAATDHLILVALAEMKGTTVVPNEGPGTIPKIINCHEIQFQLKPHIHTRVDIKISLRATSSVPGRFRNRLDPLITKTNILLGDVREEPSHCSWKSNQWQWEMEQD